MKTINDAILPLKFQWPWAFSRVSVRSRSYGGIRAIRSVMMRLCALSLGLSLALLRTLAFLFIAALAVADAIVTRIVAVPTGVGLAHARAKWLHRWSRAALMVIWVRLEQRGVMPPSGIITARYSFFFDAILLASIRPCVFVAGAEVRRWPALGLLAQLGGTVFVNPRRRNDLARVNFLIGRALRRRLPVIIFHECGNPAGSLLRPFASALLQPAVELRCSLAAAAFAHQTRRDGESAPIGITHKGGLLGQFAQLVGRWRPLAIAAFHGPVFHHGDRKQLASQLRIETRELIRRISTPDGMGRHAKTAHGGN